jgi:hypothetical protein
MNVWKSNAIGHEVTNGYKVSDTASGRNGVFSESGGSILNSESADPPGEDGDMRLNADWQAPEGWKPPRPPKVISELSSIIWEGGLAGNSQIPQRGFSAEEFRLQFPNLSRFMLNEFARRWIDLGRFNAGVGVAYGTLGASVGTLLGSRPGVKLADGQIQFYNNPLGVPAITFGEVGVYNSSNAPWDEGPGGWTNGYIESQHTLQSYVLGPLYLPLHAYFAGRSIVHEFSQGNYNLNDAWHGPENLLEIGPHSYPPRPWP